MDKMTKEYFVWSMAKAIAPKLTGQNPDVTAIKRVAENVMQAANVMVDAWQNMFGIVLPRHSELPTLPKDWEVSDNFGEHLKNVGYDKATHLLKTEVVLRRDFLPENFKECDTYLRESPLVKQDTIGIASPEIPHRLSFMFVKGTEASDANKVVEWLGDKPFVLDVEVDVVTPSTPAVYGGVAYGVTVGEEGELS